MDESPFRRRRLAPLVLACWVTMADGQRDAGAGEGFLDEAAVRETLVGHTLRGKDWTEFYTADGEIRGRGRHLGIRDYGGRWTVEGARVCYHYGHASFDTCSWLRRDGERVSHHRQDGTLKKDGIAVRRQGDRLGEFR